MLGAGERLVRSFVAIEVGPPAREAVEEYLAALRSSISGVAWTRPENLHLTFKFLGAVAPSRLESLGGRLAAVAKASAAFTLTAAGVGAFPSLTRPRVLWVGIAAPGLAALAGAVEDACAAEGFAPESRGFHPHVTLGRVREAGGRARGRTRRAAARGTEPSVLHARLAADGARGFGTSRASALLLFQSELHRDGARHAPLRVFPLADEEER